MNVAIITARGGSKRIPRKNIRSFAGRPIIEYPINVAMLVSQIDLVIVSTDDEQIAAVAMQSGASVPFVRPAELSDDFTGSMDVMRHAIEWVEDNLGPVSNACCLYPTSPFLTSEHLVAGYQKLIDNDAEFSFSATTFASTIFRSFTIEAAGNTKMVWPEHQKKRSQELPEAYHDAGMFYWGKRDAFFERDGFFSDRSFPVVIPRYQVHDIDTPEDWHRAELIYKALKQTRLPATLSE